jgi:hypothetical protein
MNAVVETRLDGLARFYNRKSLKVDGLGPTADWLSLLGPKTVSKEKTALAAGMFVTVRFIE